MLVSITLYSTNKKKTEKNDSYNIKQIINFALPTTLIWGLGTLIVFSGPIFIKLLGGSYKLAGLFTAAFILVRIPLYLSGAVYINLLPSISKADAVRDKNMVNMYIKKSILFFIVLSILMVIGVWFFGPQIMQLIYGKKFIFGRVDLVLLSMITGCYLLAFLFNQILLAKSLLRGTLLSWSISSALLVLFIYLINLDLLLRVELGLLFSSFSVMVFLLIILIRS